VIGKKAPGREEETTKKKNTARRNQRRAVRMTSKRRVKEYAEKGSQPDWEVKVLERKNRPAESAVTRTHFGGGGRSSSVMPVKKLKSTGRSG